MRAHLWPLPEFGSYPPSNTAGEARFPSDILAGAGDDANGAADDETATGTESCSLEDKGQHAKTALVSCSSVFRQSWTWDGTAGESIC